MVESLVFEKSGTSPFELLSGEDLMSLRRICSAAQRRGLGIDWTGNDDSKPFQMKFDWQNRGTKFVRQYAMGQLELTAAGDGTAHVGNVAATSVTVSANSVESGSVAAAQESVALKVVEVASNTTKLPGEKSNATPSARPAQNPVPQKSPSLADLGLQRNEASAKPEVSTGKLASLLEMNKPSDLSAGQIQTPRRPHIFGAAPAGADEKQPKAPTSGTKRPAMTPIRRSARKRSRPCYNN